MPFFTEHELILPRKDFDGNPTGDNFYHTLPSPDGPKTIQGYMGDDDQKSFFYSLGWFTRGTALELGSFYGLSSVLFALGMKHSPWQSAKLICLDWFGSVQYLAGENTVEKFMSNMKMFGVDQYVQPVKGSCEDPNAITKQELEWVYFDASHEFAELKVNIDIYAPWIKPGGLMIFHDSNQSGVQQALKKVKDEYGAFPAVVRPDYEAWCLPSEKKELSIVEMWEEGNK